MFANCDVNIPLPGAVPAARYDALPRSNFIDEHVWAKLRKLGLLPSAPAGDATYLRRAYLDVIGRLPSTDEVRQFLADTSTGKRARLVDRLLDRPEYADHWANKWVDLLRPNPYRVGIKAVLNLDGWIRDAFRRNMPYDQFVHAIVTARGSTFEQGPATIFRDRREPEEIAPMISQLFLGIRLECAKCHHHPFESWDQAQFYEFAAYFARVGRKGTGLSPPISGSEEIVYTAKSGSVKHPLTGKILAPRALFGSAPVSDDPDSDPREALARWMIAPENPYFARVIVNRVWAEIMGRGIVDPVDDLRATNPPSNGPLLDALADDFRRHGYDLKHLIGTILSSSVYALGSEPNDRNVADTRNFSRHYRQRLRAEVLLDAISDVTGVPDTFAAAPPGSRASAIWTHRVPSLFLDTFGRPDPNQDPPCERTGDTSVVQALHLMNAPDLHKKVTSDAGRAARLASGKESPRAIVEELYLLTYARLPDRRGAGRRRVALRGPQGRPPRGGRRPVVGITQLGGVCLQRLIENTCLHRIIGIERRVVSWAFTRIANRATRRDCLRLGLGALIGGGLIDALRLRGEAALAGPRPSSCILIWMDGGPSHYETFDPKPGAPKEIRGEFSPIATAVPGVFFSEPMKRLASIADKLAIVRSICHNQGNHGAGNHYMMTGAPTRIPVGCGAFVSFHPSLGSVTAHERGSTAGCRRISRCPACRGRAGRTSWGRSMPRSWSPMTRTETPSRSGTSRRPGDWTTIGPTAAATCVRASTASVASPTRPRAIRP